MSETYKVGDRVTVKLDQELSSYGLYKGAVYEVGEVMTHNYEQHVRLKKLNGGLAPFMYSSRFNRYVVPPAPCLPLGPAPVNPAPVSKETDPTGKALNEKGAKADAGKLKPTLVFQDMADALVMVIKIATDGAIKYTPGGWLEVPDAQERYDDADLRHMLKRYTGQPSDADSGSLHLAHEAWNALAKLQLFLNNNPEHKVKF